MSERAVIPVLAPVQVNPFRNYTSYITYYERFKLATLGILIAPIRGLFFGVCVILGWLVCKLVSAGTRPDRPLSATRRALVCIISTLARIGLFVLGYYWISEKGEPDPNANIIVCNHVGFIDPLYFTAKMAPSFVSRKENRSIPFIGTIMDAMRIIWVDRHDRNSRITTAKEISDRAESTDWPPMIIFPEGTCNNQRGLLQFRTGAFSPKQRVQPVLLKYEFRHFDLSWGSGINMPYHIWRTLSQFINHMEVEWLPSRFPTQEEMDSPLLFANNVRHEMARRLDIPYTEHSYEDVWLGIQAGKINMDAALTAEVELKHVRAVVELSESQQQALLRDYYEFDKESRGYFSLTEFADCLCIPYTHSITKALFKQIDTNNSGFIDFREFFVGVGLLATLIRNQKDNIIKNSFKRLAGTSSEISSADFRSAWATISSQPADKVSSRLFHRIADTKAGPQAMLTFKRFEEVLSIQPMLLILHERFCESS